MKILCRTTDLDEVRPAPFDMDMVKNIIDDVHTAILDKYGRRFRKIDVEIDDVLYDDYTVSFHVDVFNGDVLKMSKEFEFTPYSDYWDVSDYNQHLSTTITRFVDNLNS